MYVGSASEIRDQIADNLKGEFICIVESSLKVVLDIEEEKLLKVLLEYHDLSTASKIVAKVLGVKKREIYKKGMNLMH